MAKGNFFGGQFFGGGFFGTVSSGGGGIPQGFLGKDVPSWRESIQASHEARELERKLAQAKKEIKAVDTKIRREEKRAVKAGPAPRPQGILANLHRLEVKREAIQLKIQGYEAQLLDLEPLITASKRSQELDDDDDEAAMLLL